LIAGFVVADDADVRLRVVAGVGANDVARRGIREVGAGASILGNRAPPVHDVRLAERAVAEALVQRVRLRASDAERVWIELRGRIQEVRDTRADSARADVG